MDLTACPYPLIDNGQALPWLAVMTGGLSLALLGLICL